MVDLKRKNNVLIKYGQSGGGAKHNAFGVITCPSGIYYHAPLLFRSNLKLKPE